MTDEAVCQHRVYPPGRFSFSHPCGRPVKSEGLCARHLAGKRRSEAANQKMRADQDESQRNKESALRLAAQLERFGIKGKPYYLPSTQKYTGGVVLDSDEVERLVERLGSQ